MHLDNVVDSGGSRRQVLTQATRCWSGQHSHWGMSICRTGACASVVVRTLKQAACRSLHCVRQAWSRVCSTSAVVQKE